jgi:hypothetical protein
LVLVVTVVVALALVGPQLKRDPLGGKANGFCDS